MKEFLYRIVEWIAECHNYLLKLNDAYEYHFTDKELHFLVIGCIGMMILLVAYPVFRILAKHKMYLTITGIYTFTVVVVLTFAIEIGQKISKTGTMEFADIMSGVIGFLMMFALVAVIKGIYHIIRYFVIRAKQKKTKESFEEFEDMP